MRKKLLMALSFSLLAFAGIVSAQNQEDNFPIPAQKGDVKEKDAKSPGVVLIPTSTAFISDDDPLSAYSGKISNKNAMKEWIFIDVYFPVMEATRGGWSNWLDDVEVSVEVLLPGYTKTGKSGLVAFHGSQILNPIKADGETHHVRFFIPPYVLARYAYLPKAGEKGGSALSELKKIAKDIPVCASIRYKNGGRYITRDYGPWLERVLSGDLREQLRGKTDRREAIVALFGVLRNSRTSYYENVILPAELTPWIYRDWDKFESMKMEQSRSGR